MRAFIAIDLDQNMRDTAAKIIQQQSFEHMRWTKLENMHLTLQFLESITDEQAQFIGEKLDQALSSIPTFRIETRGTICFPKRRPRVFAIAISLSEELAMLTKSIWDITSEIGIQPDKRPFLPHITMGRFKSPPHQEPGNFLEKTLTQEVAGVSLYRSDPGDQGSVYSLIHHTKLTAQP